MPLNEDEVRKLLIDWADVESLWISAVSTDFAADERALAARVKDRALALGLEWTPELASQFKLLTARTF